jgi:Transferase family
MITPIQPNDVLTVPVQNFKTLRLCLDDVLPVSIVLLLGYSHRLEPQALRSSLQSALLAFPHLSGRIQVSLEPLQAELVPGEREVQIEWNQGNKSSLQDLELLDQETLFAHFAPSAAANARTPIQALQAPLLQLRLTWLSNSNACVLGLMVSHMVLDGTGLALFLNHLTAGLQGKNAPAVVHDRWHTYPDPLPKYAALPPQYQEISNLALAMALEQDPLAASPSTVFFIPVKSVQQVSRTSSLTDARLFLAAHLCQEVAAMQPSRSTLALWCNTRGLGHVPRNYTGNAGCYMHYPLAAGQTSECFQNLKRTITREGFAEIAKTYAYLKAGEASGRAIFWHGPGEDLLSLNLVPHVRGAADFGYGGPVYAQLLTRNVSGLRIFSSSDGSRFVVEACLPSMHGARLISSCENLGIAPFQWHLPGLKTNQA